MTDWTLLALILALGSLCYAAGYFMGRVAERAEAAKETVNLLLKRLEK